MSEVTFKKAQSKRRKGVQTEITAEGYHFTVNGETNSTEEFIKIFKAERAKETYLETCFVNGVYNENLDMGYKNLIKVIKSGDYKMNSHHYDYFYRVPAELKCCGEWLSLGSFTNTCPHCGADYNGSGQSLASRHFWGEETGESWFDCY